MTRSALGVALAVLATLAACRSEPSGGPGEDPMGEARRLVEEGRYDEAIASVGAASDAEALYLLGRAWAGKARTAPVPTPAPGSSLPAGALLKPEEAQALDFLGRAIAAQPDHAAAHLATAELLAPHALAVPRGTRRGGAAETGGAGAADVGVERVLQAYSNAVEANPSGTEAVEGLIRFATEVGRVKEADAAYQELTRRRREDAGVLVRYGDFLAGPGDNPEAALAPYSQALIWRTDDAATRLKIARIHLEAASGLLASQQYVTAEARLKEARRHVGDPSSPEAARLRELEGRIREIRGR